MLDINSDRGKRSLFLEREMMERLKSSHGWSFMETPKSVDSPVDGFLSASNEITAVYETKCRMLSLEQIQQLGSWLITNKKIKEGQKLSQILRVPFWGLLVLVDGKKRTVLKWEITDAKGNFKFDFDTVKTPTKKNINGGTANRLNSFLPIKHSEEICTYWGIEINYD
jgi:hypothetical protein